jgi:hypothetical protein
VKLEYALGPRPREEAHNLIQISNPLLIFLPLSNTVIPRGLSLSSAYFYLPLFTFVLFVDRCRSLSDSRHTLFFSLSHHCLLLAGSLSFISLSDERGLLCFSPLKKSCWSNTHRTKPVRKHGDSSASTTSH